MIDLLFITDDFFLLEHNLDATCLMMVTAQEMGYNVYSCLTKDLFIQNNEVFIYAQRTHLLYSSSNIIINDNWYTKDNPQIRNSRDFNAIIVRKDPPFDIEYYYLTQILMFAEQRGAKVHNNSFSLRNFNEKLAILNFPELIVPSVVSKNKQILLNFLEQNIECIIKPLNLMGGKGILKVSLHDLNCLSILNLITNDYQNVVMLQKFIPEVQHGDKRIIIINGDVINQCLHRFPKLININQHYFIEEFVTELSPQNMLISQKVAHWLTLNNISFAGIDIIGDYLTEINITSPAGLKKINDLTQFNIASIFFKKIL